ncbi:MAG: leucyl/phenylalanyl-tRNA--protein transferase [Phycisphaeraceae bacterium]
MKLTPHHLLNAYCQGVFPMADGAEGEIAWYTADPRAIQPFREDDALGSFRVRRSLAKIIRKGEFVTHTDCAFDDVIAACAEPRGEANGVWINDEIKRLYAELHRMGFAHSVETYRDDRLVGGLYGVSIGSAFFGESMFSREPFASQVAYVGLIERLRKQGYRLLDVQFVNPHLQQFGVVEVDGERYLELLESAIDQRAAW